MRSPLQITVDSYTDLGKKQAKIFKQLSDVSEEFKVKLGAIRYSGLSKPEHTLESITIYEDTDSFKEYKI